MAIGGLLIPRRGRLLVGTNVKIDKQEQIASEKSATKDRSTLGSRAGAEAREGRPVRRAEVRVAGKVDGNEVDDELSDLHGGKILLPPDLPATRSSPVVIIHEHMHGQVEHDRNPGNTGTAVELSEAQEGSGSVVEDVQER